MSSLRKNVASQNFTFVMLSATTGAVDASATVTVYVTKDNGSQATGTGTVTNSGHGQYNYAPTQAETNATDVGFLCTATGDIAVNLDFHTDVVDANGLPSVNTVDWNGTAVSSPATAGIPDVNVKNINNVAAATPGASGGATICGSNAATTFATLTVTGNMTLSDGLIISRTTSNASAISAT